MHQESKSHQGNNPPQEKTESPNPEIPAEPAPEDVESNLPLKKVSKIKCLALKAPAKQIKIRKIGTTPKIQKHGYTTTSEVNEGARKEIPPAKINPLKVGYSIPVRERGNSYAGYYGSGALPRSIVRTPISGHKHKKKRKNRKKGKPKGRPIKS